MGSRSKSSANQTTTTNNIDRRLVNESGIVATEGSTLNATITTVDADIVDRAMRSVDLATANNNDGFTRLLDSAEKMFGKSTETASTMASRYTQDVMQGISSGLSDAKGTFDQKTIIILGVAAAAAVVAVKYKR